MTGSQRYLSSRGGSSGISFEAAVLRGLASDGGLFVPESIPSIPSDWQTRWNHLSYQDLAYEILSLYISPSEVPASDLRELIDRSYSTFRHPDIAPVVPLIPEDNLHVLELFHGPTFAFKDVALQFVGNLFEYFLQRKNAQQGETSDGKRHALTVLGATSGDTGSAAIYALRGKKDVSVFILHPRGRVTGIQEAQMTTVLDDNVHNLAVEGTFDDCQDIVKALFSDPGMRKTHNLGAVNSINWARILVQIVYYFSSYFALANRLREAPRIRYVVPTGNFGDILAGYFAKRMGLPVEQLVIATNENDILDRFVKSGRYEKHPAPPAGAAGGTAVVGAKAHEADVKQTLSPAMDILVSSNFERLLWYLALEAVAGVSPGNSEPSQEEKAKAGQTVMGWMTDLKTSGTTVVPDSVLDAMKRDFASYRVSDPEIVETIKKTFTTPPTAPYVLDPHTAVGIAASLRLIEQPNAEEGVHTVSLSTAHPAKFHHAVDIALGGEEGYDFDAMVRPKEFFGLEEREKRVTVVERPDAELVKRTVEELLAGEGKM